MCVLECGLFFVGLLIGTCVLLWLRESRYRVRGDESSVPRAWYQLMVEAHGRQTANAPISRLAFSTGCSQSQASVTDRRIPR